MPDDIKLPEPVALCRDGALFWRGDHAAHRGDSCDLYSADQLRAVISAALASRPYKLPPMPAVFQHMPPLPPPFRAGGQQIADDGNDKVFCDLWERGQVEAHARAAVEADRAQQAAEIERLRTDAERYRWLRSLEWFAEAEIGLEIDGSAWRVTFSSPAPFENANYGPWLDAAIDAAIEAAHGIPAPKGGSES